MTVSRSYDDPCGLSRALNRVGERWALLVVRELVYGPKRFADLRRGLPGISPNVLSQRLDELESHDVLRRRLMPAPVSGWVYELTDVGAGLAPALIALARWGSRLPVQSARELSPNAFWLALETTYLPGRAGSGKVVINLDGESKEAQFDDRALTWVAVASRSSDAIISTTQVELRTIVFGDRQFDDALREQTMIVEGDTDLARRLIASFERPPTSILRGHPGRPVSGRPHRSG